jgi:hypothetical protein
MTTKEARGVLCRRKELSEPVFGILKEQQGARRFLLRGLANVRAEAKLLATAFNLRTLYHKWQVLARDSESMALVKIMKACPTPAFA